ncbi:Vacuolar sorting protein 9 domain isoform 1 [Theobroma cacao]|uniref:Vacuolar sorting protein 9 domain isoform 1 n=1 Tax=Theobroma cacao TaxID=3641 RepID=A0A061FIN5_THECC|nr:Vacuolar sorting protein 9 domain isoform 1 [Theobroma cacao]EOY16951.1 Vacuolar sorting protein 9 domain isoform 1 [Theobroma cacao]
METTHSLPFDSFLDKMRNPASLDLVRSIKSFIVSFSFNAGNPENDGKRIQDFFLTTEAAIRDHPLWAGSTDEEIDNALEGLEKYVMTKLHSRTFASSAEDIKMDREISEKICLLQTFLRPEHLDIPVVLQNEASWLLAEKELKKINAFKAPREKLLCIMNCCRVINNLLLNASISEDHVPGGADDFLPVLIYVTIKANPPQLHSNLKFIQLYRRQSKLISEAAYYHTNLVSAKSFIVDLNAKSLSIEETEFEESMQAARLVNRVPQITSPTIDKISTFGKQTDPGPSTEMHKRKTNINDHHIAILGSAGSNYPYMEAEAGELTVADVERLLGLYKDVVTKYNSLCNTVRHLSISKTTVSPASEGTNDLLRGRNGTSRDTDCKGD